MLDHRPPRRVPQILPAPFTAAVAGHASSFADRKPAADRPTRLRSDSEHLFESKFKYLIELLSQQGHKVL
jgi:hypothetical protein